MADQHRRGYDDEFPQGRGWNDRDDWRQRYGDDARRRLYEANPGAYERERAWRDQGDGRYPRGDDRDLDRGRFGGTQDQRYGQYSGSQYGGVSSYGRGYPESEFMPHRVHDSPRWSEGRGSRDEGREGAWGGREGGVSDPYWAGERGRDRAAEAGDYRSHGDYRTRRHPDMREASRPVSGEGYSSGYSGGYSGGRSSYSGYTGGEGWQTGGGYGGSTSFRESYSGRGPKDYRRSDDRIREDVSDRLERDAGVDASDITVTVKDGEVTLSGTVASRDQKRCAEDCVEHVSGVREVHNTLRVQRADRSNGPSPENSSSLLGLGGQAPRDADADANAPSATEATRKASGAQKPSSSGLTNVVS